MQHSNTFVVKKNEEEKNNKYFIFSFEFIIINWVNYIVGIRDLE